MNSGWTRSEKLAFYSLLVAVIGVLVALFIPELRERLGLNPERVLIFSSNQPTNVSTANTPPTLTDASRRRSDEIINMPANRAGWYAIGTGKFVIEVTGEIDFGGVTSTPKGYPLITPNADPLAPYLPFGALVAKIGSEKPFVVGYEHNFDTREQVYIAVNDSIYSDNKGSFTVRIKR